MLNKIKTLIAVAALSGTVGTNVYAAQKEDTARVNPPVVENNETWNQLTADRIQSGNVLTIATTKHADTLRYKATNYHVRVSQIKEWHKLITDLIHPGFKLAIFDGLNMNKAISVKQEKGFSKDVIAHLSQALGLTTALGSAPAIAPAATSSPATAEAEATPTASAPNSTPAEAEVVPITPTPSPAPAMAEVAPTPSPAPATPPAKVEAAPEPAAPTTQEPTPAVDTSSKEITVKATAYTASCEGCSGITATGINIKANPDERVIAVDPSVIPLGSKVYVEGFGEATAADTGGAIKGNRIDVFIPSEQDAVNFGVKQLKVKILN